MKKFEIGKTYIFYGGNRRMRLSWVVISRTAGTVTIKNRNLGEIKRNIILVDSVENEQMEAVRVFKKDRHSILSAYEAV